MKALLCSLSLLLIFTAGSEADDRSPEANDAFLIRCQEHAKQERLDEYANCWADEAMNNGHAVKKERIRVIMEDIRRTFPDYHSKVQDKVIEGDTIVTISRVSGTHRGVAQTVANGGLLRGVKPTGKRFEVLQTHWWKFKDGKIVFHQAVRDDLGMMRQLGLIPDDLAK
jgi:predicted ester cyclase